MVDKAFLDFLYKQYYNAKAVVEKLVIEQQQSATPTVFDVKLNSSVTLRDALESIIEAYIDSHNGNS